MNDFWKVVILDLFFIDGKIFLIELGKMLDKCVFSIGFGLILRNIMFVFSFFVFCIVFWKRIGLDILVV